MTGRIGQRIAFIAVYLVASAVRLLAWVLSTGDCHGPGAQFPGGCPAFARGMDLQTLVFVGGGLLLLIAVQVWLRQYHCRRRWTWLAFLLYGALLLVGPFFLFVPPSKI